ncbi:MAG TPA: ABC transporter ATP-binding protein, partial [Porticoccaceae bacterium]|nr:ABC transporter ATP-binding protein [Porticoccaceae bacterium]
MQSSIRFILGFVAPYRWRWMCAIAALLFTAGVTLSLGQGVRLVIDAGFVAGSTEQLRNSVLLLMFLSFLMAGGTY